MSEHRRALVGSAVSDYTVPQFLDRYPTVLRSNGRTDTGVILFSALERAWEESAKPYQRTRLTPCVYQDPGDFRLLSVKPDVDYSGYRRKPDTPADAEFLPVYAGLRGPADFTLREVSGLLESDPAPADKNKQIWQKALNEG
jgi:spore coat polysaccharide biosynthesis protein SpsF